MAGMTDDPSWAALGARATGPRAAAAPQAGDPIYGRFEPPDGATELHRMILDFGAALTRAGHVEEGVTVAAQAEYLDHGFRNARAEMDLLAALQTVRDLAGDLADMVRRYPPVGLS